MMRLIRCLLRPKHNCVTVAPSAINVDAYSSMSVTSDKFVEAVTDEHDTSNYASSKYSIK